MHRIAARGAVPSLFLVILALALPAPTDAHALLSASDPAKNAVLAAGPSSVTLTFTEAPDAKLSHIQVLDGTGTSCAAGSTQAVPGQPTELQLALRPLGHGSYTVAWQAVSSLDGHNASGSFAFSVGQPAGSGSAAGSVTPTGSTDSGSSSTPPLVVLARWLMYLGLIGVLGAAFMGAIVALDGPTRGVRGLLLGSWVLALVATLGFGLAQAADAGAGIGDMLASSMGRTFIARLLPLVAAAPFVWIALRSARWRRVALLAAGLGAVVAMGVDASTSHAAAGPLPVLNITLQWLHIVVAGMWLGGVAALVLQVRSSQAELRATTARRFALFAGFGLAFVAASGLTRAVVESGAIGSLFAGQYGLMVAAKVGLVGGLALLGAVNHFWNVPAVGRNPRGLLRVGSVEIVVATLAFLSAAVIVNVPPPLEAAAAAPAAAPASSMQMAPLVVLGTDYATTVKLRLTLTPGMLGPNAFSARVVDYDTGAPVSATKVQLRFELPARPDIGASDLILQPASAGTYEASGSNLSMTGTWTVTALVERGAQSVEVAVKVQIAP